MRDKRKSQEYFESYLKYQYSRIEKKTQKLADSDSEKAQRILLSLTGYEADLLRAEYSSGASSGSLKTLLIQALDIVGSNKKMTYEDILLFISMAIIFDAKKSISRLLSSNKDLLASDRLLNYLASFIDTGKAIWNQDIPLSEEYVLMEDVIKSHNHEQSLLKYLDRWYDMHSESAWHDSHLRDTDTYCGYWSFESAAIARILSLNTEEMKKSEYFPLI